MVQALLSVHTGNAGYSVQERRNGANCEFGGRLIEEDSQQITLHLLSTLYIYKTS